MEKKMRQMSCEWRRRNWSGEFMESPTIVGTVESTRKSRVKVFMERRKIEDRTKRIEGKMFDHLSKRNLCVKCLNTS
ncbi:hypothetical protein SLEP1_g23528 [Rubroshorea leprosula]|uniref:Uncharacterized protein n=1 Tax=Rubroshorea leprosula TaxID=152421 RepID=A0AAV5JIV5_9ROSI|nr:hypothetical protein SLEP1_g23528 [Rubroshorea leprosula]